MKREDKKLLIMNNIMESTIKLLHQKAWHTLKAEEICSHAEVSKRTFYSYYPSLDALYLAIIRKAFILKNEYLISGIDFDDDIHPLLLSMARTVMQFSFDYPVEGGLLQEYNEMLYLEKYPDTVKEISMIANKYELSQVFKMKSLDETKYTPALALFLWSSVMGWIDVMHYKAEWIEQYYHVKKEVLFEEHLHIIKKFLEEL